MAVARELLIPEDARKDPKGFELLRVWIANGEQQVSLRAGVWEDPASWGMMLADLAGHIANTFEQATGMDHAEALDRIREGLEEEWGSPRDELSGELSE